jgi:hypothetical protein
MSNTTGLLDRVDVAKPCTANWEEMEDLSGDDKVRHCASCDLDVYNLSAMRRDEAEEFVASRVGMKRTCIRFYRRTDGTLLTQDCPVGVRAAWKKMKWAAAALVAGGFAAAAMLAPRGVNGIPQVAPLKQIYEFVQRRFAPPPPPVAGAIAIRGQMAPPAKMGDYAPPPREWKGEASIPLPADPVPPLCKLPAPVDPQAPEAPVAPPPPTK